MAAPFLPGQRWISDGEPELGLGSVDHVGPRAVTMVFPATGETRQYALEQAPLRRARFREGDTLTNRQGVVLVVRSVREEQGLLVYLGKDGTMCETELGDRLGFSDPQGRLLAGDCQPAAVCELRMAALAHQHRRRQARVRGFLGGRIDLLPHQLYVASEVTGRLAPRVLLADEVGLGKTIEACLILHRLLLTGRARRVLILVPDSLVHQWFLELYRRFNLWFHIFDEARCDALEQEAPGSNPFLEAQLVLCALSYPATRPERARQALEAGWDLLVVDEAHHLGWTPTTASAEYALVERLGQAAPGLLLLTATPEQLGMASHFGRLRLLDPDRFASLDAFLRQNDQFRTLAQLADRLLAPEPLAPADLASLGSLLRISAADLEARQEHPGAREAWVGELLDRHGTGRVMFRNARAAIAGFTRRRVHWAPLEGSGEQARLEWLAELMREPGHGKFLLICRTRAKAEALHKALAQRVTVKAALFHEGLTLVQRDRNAAWFAEERGARLLLCSEIGSEGRNFQFAHELILYDLPLDPDVLEQRIGRLDRLGQTRDIEVHVPFQRGGDEEVLARWYHEGLDAFQEPLRGGHELLEQFRERLLATRGEADLAALVRDARAAHATLRTRLEEGRDRLLELHSCRPGLGEALCQEIRALDADPALETFMLRVFEHHFVNVEDLGQRTYHLGSMGVLAETFPGLSSEGLMVTFDREHALAREDLQFLTWDHPLVTGALDLLLGSTAGTTRFSRWPGAKAPGLYLETVFLLACVAPPHLQVDRFLPPTPLRVLVDAKGADLSRTLSRAALARQVEPGDGQSLLAHPGLRQDLLPRLLHRAQALAESRAPGIIARARQAMATQLDQEHARLQALRHLNGGAGTGELRQLLDQKRALDEHLRESRLRLDSVHLVVAETIRT